MFSIHFNRHGESKHEKSIAPGVWGIRMQKDPASDPPNASDAPGPLDATVFEFPNVVDNVPGEAANGIGAWPACLHKR